MRRALCQHVSWLTAALQNFTNSFRWCRLTKHPLGVVIDSLSHQIPSRLGQFARQRLGRNDVEGLGRFAVVPLAALLVASTRKIGCFHKRPSQIFVTAFGVVLSLL